MKNAHRISWHTPINSVSSCFFAGFSGRTDGCRTILSSTELQYYIARQYTKHMPKRKAGPGTGFYDPNRLAQREQFAISNSVSGIPFRHNRTFACFCARLFVIFANRNDLQNKIRHTTMTQDELFKKLVAHCKEYGFIFPSSEIYDGLGAVYDYGQNGVELKNNIKRYWWDSMVKLHENIVGIDAAIFMHPRTWEASGHVSAFNDPLIDNKDSKKRYRADVLIEEWIAKQDEKIEKEVEKARKRFGESFDEEKYPRHVAPRRRDGRQTRRGTRPFRRGDERQRPGRTAADHPRLRDRLPHFGHAQLDGGAAVQPDVLHPDGIDGRRGQHDLPASRNGAGHLRQLPQRPENGPHEDFRSASRRSARLSATRSWRGSSSSACANSSRWRCSSSCVRARR